MSLIPFDDRDGHIWLDGKLVPWRDAKLHVLSHGLHYASCVFEGERVYDGTVFKLTEHSQRLIEDYEAIVRGRYVEPALAAEERLPLADL